MIYADPIVQLCSGNCYLSGSKYFSLPSLFTMEKFSVSGADKCSRDMAESWDHLSNLSIEDLDSPVQLLIGSNAPHLLVAEEVRAPGDYQKPYGVKSCLGWFVIGGSTGGGDPLPGRFWGADSFS